MTKESFMEAANQCILTINGGSSSIKSAIYRAGDPMERGFYGKVDRIGLSGTNLTFHDPASNQQDTPERDYCRLNSMKASS